MRRSLSAHRPKFHGGRGVTLIELVVVITITAIIATVLGAIIVRPIQGYQAQVRRGELVDAAEMSLRQMARDVHRALPNSVRVDATNHVIEMLNTLDGARYRDGPGQLPGGHNHANTPFRLRIPATDSDGFNIVGFFQNIPALNVSPFTFTSTTERLAIYNQTATGANSAYADALLPSGPYVITNPNPPANTKFTISKDGGGFDDEHQILPVGGANFNFRWASPNQRVYIVDTPITYLCTPGANGTITRYRDYSIVNTPQPTNPVDFVGGTNALLTTPVSACTFTYDPGTNQRAGLVTLSITLTDNASGESVRLLYQVHVDNTP